MPYDFRILAFHRILKNQPDPLNMMISPEVFESLLGFLERRYEVVSLDKAVDLGSKALQKCHKIIVITFDDGYQDNFTNAFALLHKYRMPATIFLSVANIRDACPMWWDSVMAAVLNTQESNLDLSSLGWKRFPLRKKKQKMLTILGIVEFLKKWNDTERRKLLQQIFKQLRVNGTHACGDRMSTWVEIKHMRQHQITFGAHGMSHTIFTNLPIAKVKQEIAQSKKTIGQNLGENIRFFSYPNGGQEDYNADIFNALRSSGFDVACTLNRGSNRLNGFKNSDSLFQLKRYLVTKDVCMGLSRRFSPPLFAAEISGIFDLILPWRMIKSLLTAN